MLRASLTSRSGTLVFHVVSPNSRDGPNGKYVNIALLLALQSPHGASPRRCSNCNERNDSCGGLHYPA
jgi:hypothetical protein